MSSCLIDWFVTAFLNDFVFRLENILRGFACLTKGDMIAIKYNDKVQRKDDSIVKTEKRCEK